MDKELMDCLIGDTEIAEMCKPDYGVCYYEWAVSLCRQAVKAQLAKVAPYIEAVKKAERLPQDTKDCLDTAREAITDAIFLDNGLDSGAGKKVIDWINEILGDEADWVKNHQFIVD